jgi:hypothetical protein
VATLVAIDARKQHKQKQTSNKQTLSFRIPVDGSNLRSALMAEVEQVMKTLSIFVFGDEFFKRHGKQDAGGSVGNGK